MSRRRRQRSVACLVFVLLLTVAVRPTMGQSSAEGDVRLVVFIVVDQLRADLVTRFSQHFGDDGFRRLMRDGAHFVNAYFSYGSSATAPGHATISTGRIPRQHGIVANKWYLKPNAQRAEYAVDDENCRFVPSRADGRTGARSPHRLIGPALGDQIKISDARSRVFSVSLKDRAAIFMGGQRPDGAFWWDLRTGHFISSSYYCEELPDYVTALNARNTADQYAGKNWSRLLSAEDYAGRHGVGASWSNYANLGHSFPHTLPTVGDGSGYGFYSALWCTPFGNDLVLDVVERVLANEKLGRGSAVDMLCVGFSSNDLCGHQFGLDSPEAMDMTIQTDRQVGRLLKMLDQQIGLNRCIVALAGDHGATSSPSLTKKLGLGGEYLDLKALGDELNIRLQRHFDSTDGEPTNHKIVRAVNLPWVYLNRQLLAKLYRGHRRELLVDAADFLRATDGIANVFTEGELTGPMPAAEDVHRWLAWRCYHPERSGQLYMQLKPYWYKVDNKISGHNMGFNHDRHVPIMITGPRIQPGRYFSPAMPCDIAVTVAALLGIEPPLDAVGRVLHEAVDTAPPK
ncbi:MAG: alkaline phosphatase family protein [Phycisphaerales bacterium]|nr:alkaline phosphatase family protein [Phycisphaerales bacterium]